MKRLLMSICMLMMVAGCGSDTSKEETPNSKPTEDVTMVQFEEVKAGATIAKMDTTEGVITLVLYPDLAPKAVENFTTHAKDGYYDGVIFHRVINEFMIQGGDPQGTGRGGESIWGKVFDNEYSEQLYHFRGALAMANAGPDTNGSQFYIVQAHAQSGVNKQAFDTGEKQMNRTYPANVKEKYEEEGGTPSLDGGYTVFGQVIEGMDIIDAIATTQTDSSDRPKIDVVINKITIEEK